MKKLQFNRTNSFLIFAIFFSLFALSCGTYDTLQELGESEIETISEEGQLSLKFNFENDYNFTYNDTELYITELEFKVFQDGKAVENKNVIISYEQGKKYYTLNLSLKPGTGYYIVINVKNEFGNSIGQYISPIFDVVSGSAKELELSIDFDNFDAEYVLYSKDGITEQPTEEQTGDQTSEESVNANIKMNFGPKVNIISEEIQILKPENAFAQIAFNHGALQAVDDDGTDLCQGEKSFDVTVMVSWRSYEDEDWSSLDYEELIIEDDYKIEGDSNPCIFELVLYKNPTIYIDYSSYMYLVIETFIKDPNGAEGHKGIKFSYQESFSYLTQL